jgi:hypothetical protein
MRVDFVLTHMSMGVLWVVDLFVEIPASFVRWKDSFSLSSFYPNLKEKQTVT